MPKTRIRRATAKDVPALARVSYDAFPTFHADIATREALLREGAITPIRDRLILEVEGVHSGQLTMIPFQLWLSGSRIQMGGVAGVGVSPEARRSGAARALMTEALKLMRARGDVVSLLYPFSHDFYRGYGYGLIGERHVFDIPPSSLPLYEARSRVKALRRPEYGRVHECYARLIKKAHCWVERVPKMWANKLKSDETRVFGVAAEEDGSRIGLSGYLVYEYREFEGRPGLEVLDYGAEDEASTQAILGFLSALRQQIEQVRIFAAPDERFAQRLVEPQTRQRDPMPNLYSRAGSLAYGYMGRVLDVPKALSLRSYRPCAPLTAAFTVRDPSLPGGAARAVLALGPTGATVGKDAPAAPRHAPAGARHAPARKGSLDLPVDLFSQCFFGYLPWTVAAREGQVRLRGDDILEELDHAFETPLPSLRDFF